MTGQRIAGRRTFNPLAAQATTRPENRQPIRFGRGEASTRSKTRELGLVTLCAFVCYRRVHDSTDDSAPPPPAHQ